MSTTIEWTDATWNPTTGCDRISPGCAKCYAKTLHDKRHLAFLNGWTAAPAQYHQPFEVVQVHESRLDAPLRWRKPRKVFVDSVSDLFYGDESDRQRCERAGRPFNPVPFEFVDRVFAVMALAPQHTFQVLTKRAERMRDYVGFRFRRANLNELVSRSMGRRATFKSIETWPLPNVRLGVSIENQPMADKRFPIVCELGEAGWNTMVSLEPLLGPVEVPARYLALGARAWCVPGGESGPGARPFDVAWARSIVAQCQAAGVACFVKQLGAHPRFLNTYNATPFDGDADEMTAIEPLILRSKKGGDMAEWPEDLRIREFPDAQREGRP